MSRKHFQALADAIRQIPDAETRLDVAQRIAAVCKAANSGFSFERFYIACGIKTA